MSEKDRPIIWWEPAFQESDAEAVADVIRSGYINEGQRTEVFTNEVAAYLGVDYVQATSSGTAALFLALKALGVGPGDEVIVPDLTFIATASAVKLAGAEVKLVDIDPGNLNMDPERVAEAINERTKAILPVHVNGRPADMAALRALAGKHGLALIEDAAEALGSRDNGKALGSLSDAGCISLAPTKIITTGQGGLIATNNSGVRDAIIRLKDHGRLHRSWNYHPEVGFNFKFSDILAALGIVQWGYLEERIELACEQFCIYRDALKDVEPIEFYDTRMDEGTVPLWVDARLQKGVDRDAFIEFMKSRNVICRPFWPTLHTQAPYEQAGDFRHAENAAAQCVWLPSGQGKREGDLDLVVDGIREYFKG
jgi:perosamine synthetase